MKTNSKRRINVTATIAIAALSLLLNACDPKDNSALKNNIGENSSSKTSQNNAVEKIQWYQGTIQAAFSEAEEDNTPLFLYWGAVWCPPCEEIKQTVFKSPNFIAQTQLFIPVYLDGDTERAQHWGEKFSVKGYPTMIIFNPDGDEVTRIPGGIDIDRYNAVLALSLNGLKKTTSLIERALRNSNDLTADDYTQLAFYSWDQSNLNLQESKETISIPIAELLDKLSAGAELGHNKLAASRLFLQSLVQRIDDHVILSDQDAKAAYEKLKVILNDQPLVIANLDFSMFWSEEITELISKPGTERIDLEMLWTNSMENIRFNDSLSKAQQLGTWYPQLYLYWLNNPNAKELPEDVKNQVVEHVNQMDDSTSGTARQTVINKAYQVLQAAHLNDLSRKLLLDEIEKSDSPYYFMSGLASLEEKEKNYDTAVEWLANAYAASTGQATRFQWGVEYVTGIMRMQPEEVVKISTTTLQLINELDHPIDILSGRNFKRLTTLLNDAAIWETTTQYTNALKDFYGTIATLCDSVGIDSQEEKNCKQLAL